MARLLGKSFLFAALALLGACNFWLIPIPIPLGTTTQPAVPAAQAGEDTGR